MSQREISEKPFVYSAVRASGFFGNETGDLYVRPQYGGSAQVSNENTITIDLATYDVIEQYEEDNKLVIKIKRKAE